MSDKIEIKSQSEFMKSSINEDEDEKAKNARLLQESIGRTKKEIIDHYDEIQAQIDVRTELLLMDLPEALKRGKEELLERVKEEKERSLAALAPESALVRYKNEYYQRFLQLKEEYSKADSSTNKKEEVEKKIEELTKEVQVLEDFLEDFQKRTLTFEEADKSVYASLIGELIEQDPEVRAEDPTL
jgi:pyruvate-formate lyase